MTIYDSDDTERMLWAQEEARLFWEEQSAVKSRRACTRPALLVALLLMVAFLAGSAVGPAFAADGDTNYAAARAQFVAQGYTPAMAASKAAAATGQPMPAADVQLVTDAKAAVAAATAAWNAEADHLWPQVPRLTVTGGTAGERAKVRRLLAGVAVPRGTLVRVVSTLGAWGRTYVDEGAVTVGRHRFARPVTIAVRRSAIRSSKARYVVLHEVAHAAQRATASTWEAAVARAGGSHRRADYQADCMVQVAAGRTVARTRGSYLTRFHHTCTAAELRAARVLWSAVD